MSIESRAKEIAEFLGMPEADALEKLSRGFLPLHAEVTEDFRRVNPQTEDELLHWYRTTEAYIWELSAYHEDEGFNYQGMVNGIVSALKSRGCTSVLCLGDGIGDVTLAASRAGLDARYHDLYGSRTAEFAAFRFWRHVALNPNFCATEDFCANCHWPKCDSVVSLDFLEHLPNVEEWVRATYGALNPGGYFVAQNAFACGSGPEGGMPMHLACNDHWEKDWDPLLASLGFVQLSPQWYRKPE
jgi:hypothetical protein